MKLGPRVAVVTTMLMGGVLAAATWAVLEIRRADLERDLHRQARDVADAVATGIESELHREARAAAAERLAPSAAGTEPDRETDVYQIMQDRVAWADAKASEFRLEVVSWGAQGPKNWWAAIVEDALKAGAPRGRLFDGEQETKPHYAMAVPLHNLPPGDPARQVVAVLGLRRDCSYIERDVVMTARRIVPFLAAGVLIFGVLMYFLLVNSVVRPLRRLVDAIDGVAKGDLSRALLPHREDEIGSLAARFNAMTNYLREAREEEARANTARLGMETRLRHSEKLATMGQMAAEIAHEVGTPLNVIGGRARSLVRRPADPAEVAKNGEIIATQVDRITKIIRQVLDFSRKNRPTLTHVDVGRVVREALEFVDETLRRQRISADVFVAGDVPATPGDPDEIQQVCLNLLMNAIHAMPSGGTLSVMVEAVTRRKEGLALTAPAPYLMLQVSDTGEGVPAADRDKIFEAFFTTKDTGEGTGLGLAVAKGIVKDHDGWIEVDGRPGGGAVFRVFLPLTAAIAAVEEPTARPLAESRGMGND